MRKYNIVREFVKSVKRFYTGGDIIIGDELRGTKESSLIQFKDHAECVELALVNHSISLAHKFATDLQNDK